MCNLLLVPSVCLSLCVGVCSPTAPSLLWRLLQLLLCFSPFGLPLRACCSQCTCNCSEHCLLRRLRAVLPLACCSVACLRASLIACCSERLPAAPSVPYCLRRSPAAPSRVGLLRVSLIVGLLRSPAASAAQCRSPLNVCFVACVWLSLLAPVAASSRCLLPLLARCFLSSLTHCLRLVVVACLRSPLTRCLLCRSLYLYFDLFVACVNLAVTSCLNRCRNVDLNAPEVDLISRPSLGFD